MDKKNKIYWQSFGEHTKSGVSQDNMKNEFLEKLPKAVGTDMNAPSRRDFLKLMGFSTTAAILASCDKPVRKAVSYLNRPNQEVSGEADYFATTYRQNGEVIPIVAKVREGRPIKLEGNKLSVVSNGVTSARLQASVLDLYNTARLKFPLVDGQESPSLSRFDLDISSALSALQPEKIAVVTPSISSPSSQRVVDMFLSRYKGAKHIQADPVSYAAQLKANAISYDKQAIPFYQFDQAETIVSFSADFLGTWVMPTVFANQYAKNRKVNKDSSTMSRHIHFESIMTITGSNADHRYTHRVLETSVLLNDLLTVLKGGGSLLISNDTLKQAIQDTARLLLDSKNKSLVICGSNQLQDQLLVNEINQLIGANGTTINWNYTLPSIQALDTDLNALIKDIDSGAVQAVIFADTNPVFYHYAGKKLAASIKKLKISIALTTFRNETAALCRYVVPSNHYLESWNDDQSLSRQYTFTQPCVVPLFKTRQWQQSLVKWAGINTAYSDLIESYWIKKLGSRNKWKKTQRAGVLETNMTQKGSLKFRASQIDTSKLKSIANRSSNTTDLVLYQKIAVGEGSQVANPWLQEMPDPITKATWGNYVLMSYTKAKELLGIDLTDSRDADAYEVDVQKPVVRVETKDAKFELPVLITPGIEKNTIGVALGYGRSSNLGVASKDLGVDVLPMLTSLEGLVQYVHTNVTVEKTSETSPVAITQSHHSYEGRTEVVKETSLSNFLAYPNFFSKDKEKLEEDYASKTGDYNREATLYDQFEKKGIHWGMSVDLNSCIGCGACVVACNAENNVAVVGKDEVLRGHEMHWIRIDRYFSGSPENPEVIHQPMMCQHCDNAPCENVCPVSATNHSSEGLNQMAYNRCVGTRYCANNCPYKVRRFNWSDYLGADAVENNQKEVLTDVALDMNEDLTRMVLNPDVTVRSRGVMEKCSFCTQRLQAAKLTAKKEGRPLGDKVETACMQSCPTEAIVFGNILDANNRIVKERMNERTYNVLEQIHVLPNVSYLGKTRNT